MTQLSYRHRGGDSPLIGQTIPAYLWRVAERESAREALVSIPQGLRLSYRELFDGADDLARGLIALGVARGDRVGIWATDHVEWVLLQLATARVGAVLVNINPAYRGAELEHALTAARIQVLFLMPEFRKSKYVEMVRELCPEVEMRAEPDPRALRCAGTPELRQIVVFDPADSRRTVRPAPGFLTWQETLAAGEAVSPERLAERTGALEIDDPINIQFTSGTTGFPKPVVLTHHNILNNGFSIGEELRLTAEDRICVPVPFYHCFGMVVSNLGCFTHGATLVIPAEHFDAGATLEAVSAERCTILHGVPTMFVAELEHPEFERFDLSSLRSGIMAGAPCPPELLRRVIGEMHCRDILVGYGQTEASPVTHSTHPEDTFEHRTESVGTNLPHQEVKVVDTEARATVPIGRPGEICFRGYHVMKGYFEMEEATSETIDEDGWLHSGDLGVLEADGYLRITGRLKEMIIRGGENIYPAEIEAFLFRHPKVAQVAVFGMPHERLGEEVYAWVQLHEGERVEPDELRRYVAEGMAHFKVPAEIRIVDGFPMTVTGKIQKFKLRELAEQRVAHCGLVGCRPLARDRARQSAVSPE